jgi:hypothetical protein
MATPKSETTASETTADTKTETRAATKPHFATRDFNDVGTGRNFTIGDDLKEVTPGDLGNYVAAGLASTERPKTDASDPAAPAA